MFDMYYLMPQSRLEEITDEIVFMFIPAVLFLAMLSAIVAGILFAIGIESEMAYRLCLILPVAIPATLLLAWLAGVTYWVCFIRPIVKFVRYIGSCNRKCSR